LGLLGASWAPFGARLVLLGASWLYLGALLASPWAILAHLGVLVAFLEASWCHIDHPELHLGSPGSIFDPSERYFDVILLLF